MPLWSLGLGLGVVALLAVPYANGARVANTKRAGQDRDPGHRRFGSGHEGDP
jgi:hypothetical protein